MGRTTFRCFSFERMLISKWTISFSICESFALRTILSATSRFPAFFRSDFELLLASVRFCGLVLFDEESNALVLALAFAFALYWHERQAVGSYHDANCTNKKHKQLHLLNIEGRESGTHQNASERPAPDIPLVDIVLLLLERLWLAPEGVAEVADAVDELDPGRHVGEKKRQIVNRSPRHSSKF